LNLRDALDGAGGGLCLAGGGFQIGRIGFRQGVDQVKPRHVEISGKIRRIGQPGMGVVGGKPGHGHGPFRHFVDRAVRGVRGRYAGLSLPDQNAQAQIGAFGAFGLFQRTGPHVDGHRGRGGRQRVGTVGTSLSGGIQKTLCEVGKLIGHGRSFCLA